MLTSKHFFSRHALHWFLCVLSTGQPPWNRAQAVSAPQGLETGDAKPAPGGEKRGGGDGLRHGLRSCKPGPPASKALGTSRARQTEGWDSGGYFRATSRGYVPKEHPLTLRKWRRRKSPSPSKWRVPAPCCLTLPCWKERLPPGAEVVE